MENLSQRSWDPPSVVAGRCLYLVCSFLSLQLRIRMVFSAAHFALGEREFELAASLYVSSSWAFKSNVQRWCQKFIFPWCDLPGDGSRLLILLCQTPSLQYPRSFPVSVMCNWYIYTKVPGTDSACPGLVSVYFSMSVFLFYQCECHEAQVLLELWDSGVTSSTLCLHETWWDAELCQGNAWDEVLPWAWQGTCWGWAGGKPTWVQKEGHALIAAIYLHMRSRKRASSSGHSSALQEQLSSPGPSVSPRVKAVTCWDMSEASRGEGKTRVGVGTPTPLAIAVFHRARHWRGLLTPRLLVCAAGGGCTRRLCTLWVLPCSCWVLSELPCVPCSCWVLSELSCVPCPWWVLWKLPCVPCWVCESCPVPSLLLLSAVRAALCPLSLLGAVRAALCPSLPWCSTDIRAVMLHFPAAHKGGGSLLLEEEIFVCSSWSSSGFGTGPQGAPLPCESLPGWVLQGQSVQESSLQTLTQSEISAEL